MTWVRITNRYEFTNSEEQLTLINNLFLCELNTKKSKMFFKTQSSLTVQEVKSELFIEQKIKLFVLRLDLIHPITGGNKLFKLKYNLLKAKEENYDTLLTFGGAFSNHIAATAMAGKENGFKTTGIIRGEKILPLNKTLQFAADCGMQLKFISREEYRKKDTPEFIHSLIQQFKKFYLIPEGGSNKLGVKGCKEIVDAIDLDFDYVCCAVGTGTTLKGIASSLKSHQKVIGISVMQDESLVTQLQTANCKLFSNYHFGGYAKTSVELNNFVFNFNHQTGITIEPIYTGKMFYGLYDLIQKNHFNSGSAILAVHTGGLQYLPMT